MTLRSKWVPRYDVYDDIVDLAQTYLVVEEVRAVHKKINNRKTLLFAMTRIEIISGGCVWPLCLHLYTPGMFICSSRMILTIYFLSQNCWKNWFPTARIYTIWHKSMRSVISYYRLRTHPINYFNVISCENHGEINRKPSQALSLTL